MTLRAATFVGSLATLNTAGIATHDPCLPSPWTIPIFGPGSTNVLINGIFAVRAELDTITSHSHLDVDVCRTHTPVELIIPITPMTTTRVLINGAPMVRIGDLVEGTLGSITTGSLNVFAG